MSLPPLAPIPGSKIRLSIAPQEWEACLHAWLNLADLYLRLQPKEFSASAAEKSPLVEYLKTYYHETASLKPEDLTLKTPTALKLKRTCFLLVHRILKDLSPPTSLLEFEFLANLCHVHLKSTALAQLLTSLWKRKGVELRESLQKANRTIDQKINNVSLEEFGIILQQLRDVFAASPEAASLFMTGSSFLDGMSLVYDESDVRDDCRTVVAVAYFGLISLTKIDPHNISLLADHLYGLKAQADNATTKPPIIAQLVTNTSLISRLRRDVEGISADSRLPKLLDFLEVYRWDSIALPRKHTRRHPDKGKEKGRQVNGELHVHRMSLISQVQDLFPDLGAGFILKLLDEYGDDVEQVTALLLEDSLPSHLRDLDRSEEAGLRDTSREAGIEQLAPRSTPPPPPERFFPERRNVFDNDEIDRLEYDTARLHIGKKKDLPEKNNPNKAAILSALAAFDSDDDERDDTYDVEDVGGTVDTAHPDGEPGPSAKITQEENDMALFTAYKSSPELFGRTFNTRKAQPRQALKAETGMTDEAIEGWAIMLQRDTKRVRRLEAQSSSFDGKQAGLGRSAYKESPAGTETEDSDLPADKGGFRGRGRGRGRGGGRGGNAAGPSGDPNTANAQRRKEASKGSRANHNRRDQRAKKMARVGFAG